jgi:DNA-binding transcriptional LysR family regulator
LEDFDSATARIGERVRESSQAFSIGSGHIVAANILPLAMKEFLAGHPDLSIEVSDDDLFTIIEKVSAGALDMGIGSFPTAGGVRRTLFFRFSLMVIRTASDTAPHRASTTWSGLKGERLIIPSLQRTTIEQHLAQAGVPFRPAMLLNRLDTIVAMVEAGHGTGILPSHALPACQRRGVRTSRLTNPTVPVDFYQIRNRSRKLSAAAEEFTTFLRAYITRWAGRAGLP